MSLNKVLDWLRPLHLLRSSLLPSLLYCGVLPSLIGLLLRSENFEWSSLKIMLGWVVMLGIFTIPWRNKIFLSALWSVVFVLGGIEMLHWLVLEAPVTTASLYVSFESNIQEGGAFLNDYLSPWKILVFLSYLATSVGLFVKNMQDKLAQPPATRVGWVLAFVYLAGFAGFSINRYIAHNGGHYTYPTTVYAVISYNKHISDYREMLETRSKTAQVKATHQGPSKQITHVLVVGESVGRNHMSLYGYPKDTSEFTSALGSELLVYQNVVSSHSFTRGSLQHALTLSNVDNELDSMQAQTLMEIAKAAGFETWWISNQIPIGLWDNKVSAIGSTAKNVQFVNVSGDSKRALDTLSYDEKVLPPFKEALQHPANKKLIVLHLMGAHTTYKHRYPPKFGHFKGSDKASTAVAEYDNAVRYSDFVVSEVIKETRAQDGDRPTTVTYFSDHGEEVFDVRDYNGHAWHKISKYMLEIPLLVWTSKSWQTSHPAKFDQAKSSLKRSYMADDLIHSMLDLMNLQTEGFVPSKSIINPNFTPRQRLVHGKWDFDTQIEPYPTLESAPKAVRAKMPTP